MTQTPVLEVRNITKRFSVEHTILRTKGSVTAVDDVSFSVAPGEITALVGESGSGKTTVGKIIQGLSLPDSGTVYLSGRDASAMTRSERAAQTQMVFQDPFASLNPKLSVGAMLTEAVRQGRPESEDNQKAARDLLDSVGLSSGILNDYPHQFSGGQRQRLGIARALALHPKLLIADEPVSALDLSIQAQILNLILDLNESLNLSYLLITHDLAVVEQVADRVLVMREGKLEEQGSVDDVFNRPKTEYTKRLLSAALTVTT